MEENNSKIFEASLDEVLHDSMIPYAEHVIMDRALPRVEDGLKPVQRRILYTMYEMGLTPDKPHRKCAKIVGDCLGKYHPHGDTSVYDALVRMAQPFNMRMPLVNGHGNFGTVDGDSAAAYRYTEARLEAISYELLRDIEKDTVNFSLNFDDSLLEPDTLPGRYPNLLVNGAYGIAVGLATNIPTHNLAEVIDGTVAYIDNPKIKLEGIMKHIKGPDFPTGGYVIASDELVTAYKTGKGKIKIRSRVNVERDGDKRSLVISEIPFQVNKAALLKSISDLSETKDEQAAYINDVVDESDRNGMRAVVKLKKDADPQKVLNYLYKKTQLETTFGINMVAISNGKPQQMGLLDIISYYVNYQVKVILRRCKFDLDRAKERAHILEGLIIAVKNIDKVIKIIKTSENTAAAKQNLMSAFRLTEVQAQAILDLRLARLTKLETYKLEEELKELEKLIAELTAIIGDRKLQLNVVKKEMLEIRKKYKDPRRSLIISEDGTAQETEDDTSSVIIEDFVFAKTANGFMKKMTLKTFTRMNREISEKTTKNEILATYVHAKTNETIFALTNRGNVFKIDMNVLSEANARDKGYKFTEISKDALKDETPVKFFAVNETADKFPDTEFYAVTRNGVINRLALKDLDVSKSVFPYFKLKDGDRVIAITETKPDTTVIFVTAEGKCLNAKADDVKLQSRNTTGLKGITLNKGDYVVSAFVSDEEGEIVVVTDGGYYKKVIVSDCEPITRGGKGVKLVELTEGAKIIYADIVKDPYELAISDAMGLSFSINTEYLPIEARTTKGKTLKNENKKRLPVSVYKIDKS